MSENQHDRTVVHLDVHGVTVVRRMALRFKNGETVQLRTGDRRSATEARKMLKAAAEIADVEIDIQKREGFYIAVVE